MINEQKFAVYQEGIRDKLGCILGQFLQTDYLDEIEFIFDMTLPTGANQYVVRVKVKDVQRYFLVRQSTTYEFGGYTPPDVKEDVDEIELEKWPPDKVKIRSSTYVVKYKG
jgi:hypothetical protein